MKLWIVGRRKADTVHGAVWGLLGVESSEADASKRCLLIDDFYLDVMLGEVLNPLRAPISKAVYPVRKALGASHEERF